LCEGHCAQKRRGVELFPLFIANKSNRIKNGRKLCLRCNTTKPVTEFWKKKSQQGRAESILPYCKPCTDAKLRRWAEQNPEKSAIAAHQASLLRRANELEQSGYEARMW
jgi:late competence protein required for DNA uptake (superfamily II DNA/RNA helicase)